MHTAKMARKKKLNQLDERAAAVTAKIRKRVKKGRERDRDIS